MQFSLRQDTLFEGISYPLTEDGVDIFYAIDYVHLIICIISYLATVCDISVLLINESVQIKLRKDFSFAS